VDAKANTISETVGCITSPVGKNLSMNNYLG
jgi:hypothetical protein